MLIVTLASLEVSGIESNTAGEGEDTGRSKSERNLTSELGGRDEEKLNQSTSRTAVEAEEEEGGKKGKRRGVATRTWTTERLTRSLALEKQQVG